MPYGYLNSFFDYANIFQNDTDGKHSGGNGDEGNVGIVHRPGSNSNMGQATFMGSSDNLAATNDAFNTAYKILNKQSESKVIDSLTVKVQKQKRFYQKLSDELIMLDYKKDSKYSDAVKEQEIYVKLTITNPNNADGVIKSITLGNKEEELEPFDSAKENKLEKEDVFDGKSKDEDSSALNGYRMKSGDTTIYVPFKLSDWLAGNKTIHIQMQGRMYQTKVVNGEEKKVYTKESSPTTHDIDIAERQLFALR